MPVPKQEDVKAVLTDFETRLRAVVDRAWQDWQMEPNKGRFVFLPRVRAVVVFDFIARHAVTEFDKDPHIKVIFKGQQTLHFLFKNKVLVGSRRAMPKASARTSVPRPCSILSTRNARSQGLCPRS